MHKLSLSEIGILVSFFVPGYQDYYQTNVHFSSNTAANHLLILGVSFV